MNSVVLISRSHSAFSKVSPLFEEKRLTTTWCNSGTSAFKILRNKTIDLVILEESLPDMTGMQFIDRLVSLAPMTGTAIMSALTHEQFHETYEGYGVMMQLSMDPEREEITQLLERFHHIAGITEAL